MSEVSCEIAITLLMHAHRHFHQKEFRTHMETCNHTLQLVELRPQLASHALQNSMTYDYAII